MKPGMALMPLASIVWPLAADGAPAATETILPAAHHDRAALDDGAVADDDPGVRDREVLRGERRDGAQH